VFWQCSFWKISYCKGNIKIFFIFVLFLFIWVALYLYIGRTPDNAKVFGEIYWEENYIILVLEYGCDLFKNDLKSKSEII